MARRKHKSQFLSFLTLLRRYPLLLLTTMLLGGLWYVYEVQIARPAMAWYGLPQAQAWQPITWTRVLRNKAFLVGWSDLRGNPLWVKYRLQPISSKAKKLPRPQRFESDWRALNSIGQDNYNGSGYDRGHLAPNYAISRLYGLQAQLQTFLMTNITPQKPKLNRNVWQRLEAAETDVFAKRYGEVWVITGPIFDSAIERLPSSLRVEVPDAFFKILAAPTGGEHGEPIMLAFVVPQTVKGNESLSRFVTTVNNVEKLSGFDFFPKMPQPQQQKLETTLNPDTWRLQEIANRTGRY